MPKVCAEFLEGLWVKESRIPSEGLQEDCQGPPREAGKLSGEGVEGTDQGGQVAEGG